MDKNVTNNSGLSLKQGKKKMKEKAKLEAAFDSAKSADQMSIAMKNMIKSKVFEVRGMDFGIWKLAQQFIAEAKNQTFGASSNHRNKIKLKRAFHNAKSGDEMLKAYHNMESCFEEKELAMDCWRLTQQLSVEKQDPEKVLCYGKRALRCIVDENTTTDNPACLMMITNLLPILGTACIKLKRFDESLIYLNWSQRNLCMLELDSSFCAELCNVSLFSTHFRLAVVKTALGKGEEAVVHVRKIMETHEKAKTEGSIDGAIDEVVKVLEELGLSEQDKVVGAVKLLKAMKESDNSEDSFENSNWSVPSS